jgi:8-oxo-dGTP pyrophosphatase MutT (NUDIX family)
MNTKKTVFCTNCNKQNHEFKNCNEPIISWGVILIDLSKFKNLLNIKHTKLNLKNKICNINLQNFYELEKIKSFMNDIKFLMVQRRNSIGFMDFIRGKYKINNSDKIISLFEHMHPNEILLIKNNSFDNLWYYMWNNDEKRINSFKREYNNAKKIFEELKTLDKGNLDYYLNTVKPKYNFNEWGFPKGRKDKNESGFKCAIREFSEETGIDITKISFIQNIEPIEENLIGTNGIKYKHIYYIAEIYENLPNISSNDSNEIGSLGFYSFKDTQLLIRDYHVEKKNILIQIYLYYLEILLENNIHNIL